MSSHVVEQSSPRSHFKRKQIYKPVCCSCQFIVTVKKVFFILFYPRHLFLYKNNLQSFIQMGYEDNIVVGTNVIELESILTQWMRGFCFCLGNRGIVICKNVKTQNLRFSNSAKWCEHACNLFLHNITWDQNITKTHSIHYLLNTAWMSKISH